MKSLTDNNMLQALKDAIESATPRPHHHSLLAAINEIIPGCQFIYKLSEGGWYRAGGVYNADGNPLSAHLEDWVNAELAKLDENFALFLSRYKDAGLITTRHMGRTHYFVAPYGPDPADFWQLEVEELQETFDRKLIDPAQLPQDRTDLVEPIAPERLDAHPVAAPRYRFARLVDIRELLTQQNAISGGLSPLGRFMSEWSQSRVAEQSRFCEHWLIANLERFKSTAGSTFIAVPMSIHARTLKPFQWDVNKVGVEMGTQLRDFDRAAGYPGAWYFHYITSKDFPDTLIRMLKRDLDNGYQYLADKDLCLLEKQVADPYRIGIVA